MTTTNQNLNIQSFKHYKIGSKVKLESPACLELERYFDSKSVPDQQLLNGRGNVVYAEHSTLGRIVVKRYLRGGLFRHLIQSKYLRWGATRGEEEYRLLSLVRDLGVNAPEPLLFAYQGAILYDAWLVTKEIEGRKNFADLSKTNEEEARQYMDELVRQIAILINHQIFHVDLHPGNVVIDPNGKLYLLDFDKAHNFIGPRNKLRDLYLVRWRRAVIKHDLPESLSELICPGLRRNFED